MIQSVRFKNSANDVLRQLADMCVGAIAGSHREDRDKASRWRAMLRHHI
jgi:hypothetical protein